MKNIYFVLSLLFVNITYADDTCRNSSESKAQVSAAEPFRRHQSETSACPAVCYYAKLTFSCVRLKFLFSTNESHNTSKCHSYEVVAKLPAPEKSMILSQFVGAAMRPGPHRQAHTRESRAWRWGDKMAQNGDFAGAGSFATASYDMRFPHFYISGTRTSI